MKLGFATDIHLDRLPETKRYTEQRRAGREMAKEIDVLVVGGDVSIGPHLGNHLTYFLKGAQIPVYFVLGNHDFWKAPEAVVRKTAKSFSGYLDVSGVVELTPTTALVGRTGWYDTLTGNPFSQRMSTKDLRFIDRLLHKTHPMQLLLAECKEWSEKESRLARPVLEAAAKQYQRVFFVTHFPCFEQACWDPDGNPDLEERGFWPWSINTTMGHMLTGMAVKYPNVEFAILTGHTHGQGSAQLMPNLTCFGGGARYGAPSLSWTWDLGS